MHMCVCVCAQINYVCVCVCVCVCTNKLHVCVRVCVDMCARTKTRRVQHKKGETHRKMKFRNTIFIKNGLRKNERDVRGEGGGERESRIICT